MHKLAGSLVLAMLSIVAGNSLAAKVESTHWKNQYGRGGTKIESTRRTRVETKWTVLKKTAAKGESRNSIVTRTTPARIEKEHHWTLRSGKQTVVSRTVTNRKTGTSSWTRETDLDNGLRRVTSSRDRPNAAHRYAIPYGYKVQYVQETLQAVANRSQHAVVARRGSEELVVKPEAP